MAATFTIHPQHAAMWDGLLGSWMLALEAENKSPKTLEGYHYGPRQLAEWLPVPPTLDAYTTDHIRAWLTHVRETRSDETAAHRYKGLRQFTNWMLAEHEIAHDPMANIRQPAVAEKRFPVLTDAQLRTLLDSCQSRSFADTRDQALILFLADTGARVSGLTSMTVTGTDLHERVAHVTTKGSRQLVLPFGAVTAKALDRYLRMRRRDRYGDREWFWLSTTGKGRLTPGGVQQMLRRRGTRLGMPGLHPHMFRHGFADRWLRAGGSETDLMQLTGWKSRQMLTRYAASTRAERARDAHRRLSPMDNL